MLLAILGAGASHDSYAAQPIDATRERDGFSTHRPPLTKDLFTERDTVASTLRSIPQLAPWVSYVRLQLEKPSKPGVTDSVETLLAHIDSLAKTSHAMKRGSLAIRLFLRSTLGTCQVQWQADTAFATNYGTLLIEITAAGIPVCFVDFNYDTLLEDALPSVGVRLDGLDSYVSAPGCRLIKPHGALNWVREIGSVSIPHPDWNADKIAGWLVEVGDQVEPGPSIEWSSIESFAVARGPRPYWPALALPVAGKYQFECPTAHLDALQDCLPKITKVLIVGWRAVEKHFLAMLVAGMKGDPPRGLIVDRSSDDARSVRAQLVDAGLVCAGSFQLAAGFSASLASREIQGFLRE